MLTELQVKNAKPRETEYKLPDSLGLYLLVRPNGSRLWQCRYWIDKKERKASFASAPGKSREAPTTPPGVHRR